MMSLIKYQQWRCKTNGREDARPHLPQRGIDGSSNTAEPLVDVRRPSRWQVTQRLAQFLERQITRIEYFPHGERNRIIRDLQIFISPVEMIDRVLPTFEVYL